jgi:hypothetical protein
MLSVAVAFEVIWNKSVTNLVPVLRKATRFLSAESGNFSESEIEIGKKIENPNPRKTIYDQINNDDDNDD